MDLIKVFLKDGQFLMAYEDIQKAMDLGMLKEKPGIPVGAGNGVVTPTIYYHETVTSKELVGMGLKVQALASDVPTQPPGDKKQQTFVLTGADRRVLASVKGNRSQVSAGGHFLVYLDDQLVLVTLPDGSYIQVQP